MAKLSIVAGATSQSVTLFLQDSASTTGAGKTGLVAANLTAYYTFAGVNTIAVSITLSDLAAVGSAYSSGGMKEVDATNMPGVYRLDLPNAALATSKGRSSVVMVKGTGVAPCLSEIELTGIDNQDGVRMGMTALPNAAASAVGGLPLSVDTSGRVDVLKINGTSQTARDIGASVLLSAGAGAGQLDFTAGVVKANLAQILGTALTETAGQLAAAFKKFFNIATPASTMDALTLVATATNLTNAPTAGDFTAAMKTSLNAATPASVVGAVGSVTGAVGSVTAAVTVGTNNDKTGYSLSAGQLFVKKNTQITITFPMTDSTTHAPKAGLAAGITCQRSIDGGAVAACANANTELSGGLYSLVLAASDVNGAMITLILSAAGADTRFIGLVTQA